jgi:hypothetical protein
VMDVVPAYLSINTTVLKGLKETWRVSADVAAEATVLVDEQGTHRSDAVAPTSASSADDSRTRALTTPTHVPVSDQTIATGPGKIVGG